MRIFSELVIMTQFSEPQIITPITQSQDELRHKFVSEYWEHKLAAECDAEVNENFTAGFDGWKKPIKVCREEHKDRQSKRRVALIYWSKDGKRVPTIISLRDGNSKYAWNGNPAMKPFEPKASS